MELVGRGEQGMALSEGKLPLGYTEVAYAIPEKLAGPSTELLRCITR